MKRRRDYCVVAGTALALVFAVPDTARANMSNAAIDAAIPVPESANPPLLTPADVGSPAAPQVTQPSPPVGASLSSADQPVAAKLRDLLTARARNNRAALETFYSGRDFAPLWITDGQPNARAKAAIAHLSAADADGLDSSDYPIPDFKGDADSLAAAELRLTNSVIAYARHAQVGRIHFTRVSVDIFYKLDPPEPAEILEPIAKATDVRAALDSFNPPHPQFKALRAKLAEVRNQKAETGPARIANGPVLKVGMQDPRVPTLRERLGVPADDGQTFDKALSDAVKRFQQQRRLNITGTLTTATVDALNGPRRDRDADIILVNLERWRWMPRDLGNAHVLVNIPEYMLRVHRAGSTYWSTRIVVGKPSQATPIMTAMMQHITVNPTWNVPPSIIQNEYLPALQQDPNALERIGLKVSYNRDGTIHVYQPPGERNALGRIRFNFPNQFLVYQHDTPDKHLFAHDKRAYSHGCMRVQDPLKYGEVLLSLAQPNEGYTVERLRRMFGSAEQNIHFPKHIPVHLTYQTAFVDDGGKLTIREDIYGRDARMIAILKGEERKVADAAVERRPTTMTRPVRAPAGFNGGFYSGGPSFFDRLFGGPPVPPAPVERRAFR